MPRKYPFGESQGERQRLRILALISKEGAMSINEIASRVHLSPNGALKHMQVLRNETPRRAYIASYATNGTGRPAPQYAAGDKPDTKYTRETVLQTMHQRRLSRLVMELEKSPRSNRELAAIMGLSVSGVRNLVNELRAMKWCKIVDWGPVINRNAAPIFGLGVGKDKKKSVKTRAERWKEEKADKDSYEFKLAKRRARDRVSKIIKKPQSIFSALGL